jgi:predicted CXXCH cytochrome family protein
MNLHRDLAIAGVLLVSVVAWPQNSGENSDKHDLNGQRCIACHVPRASLPLELQPKNVCDKKLLWDCELLTRTFQTYDAPMPSGNTTASVLDETQVRMSSLLCASCHDGVATFTMSGTNGFRARSPSSAVKGLQNEHPIDVSHDPAKDPSLAALNIVSRQVKLFGNSKVQCATCHNVHDSSDPKLLRLPNNNSALCLTCHL